MKRKKVLSSFLAWLLVLAMLIPNSMVALAEELETTNETLKPTHVVRFVDAEGNELKTTEIEDGQRLSNEEFPELGETPEGKEFWGWYRQAEGQKANEAITARSAEVENALITYDALSDEEKAEYDCNDLPNELTKEEAEAEDYDSEEAVIEDEVLEPVYGNAQKDLPTNPEPVAIAPMAIVTGDEILLENGDVLTFNGTTYSVAGTNAIPSGTVNPGVTYVEIADGASVTINTVAETKIKYVHGDQATATFTGTGKLITDNGFADQSQAELLSSDTISALLTAGGVRQDESSGGAVVNTIIVDGGNVLFQGDQTGTLAIDINIINGATFEASSFDAFDHISTDVYSITERSKAVYATRNITITDSTANATGFQTGFTAYDKVLIDNSTVYGCATGGGNLGGVYAYRGLTICNGAQVTGITETTGAGSHYYSAGIGCSESIEITGATTNVVGRATASPVNVEVYGIWASGHIRGGDASVDHDVLVIDGATVTGLGGTAICVGSRTTHEIGAVTRIKGGAKVYGGNDPTNGCYVGFASCFNRRGSGMESYAGKVYVTEGSTLTAETNGITGKNNYRGIDALQAKYLTIDNSTVTATNTAAGGSAIRMGADYKSTNSTVVAKVSADEYPTEAWNADPRASIQLDFGSVTQIGGTFEGEGAIWGTGFLPHNGTEFDTNWDGSNVSLSDGGTMQIKSDRTGILLGTDATNTGNAGNVTIEDASSIEIIGRTAIGDNLVGVNAGGTVSVDKGTLTAVNAKDAGIIAKGDISATTGGTINGACTDINTIAVDKGGVISMEGDITADAGTINGTTVHKYSTTPSPDHAAVHPYTAGKKNIAKNGGVINEYYTNKFQNIYKTGWQKAYADIGLTIDSADFSKYSWSSHGASSWAGAANGNIEVKSDGEGLKATAIEPTEYLIANSKSGAINSAKVDKDTASAHNVHFIVTLADSDEARLDKGVVKGTSTDPDDFKDSFTVTVKELKKDEIYTYMLRMNLPSTSGKAGYTSVVISDTLPEALPLSTTSPKSVVLKIGSTSLTLSGDDVMNGTTKVGTLTYNASRELVLTLNADGIDLLENVDSTVDMFITVKAKADVAEGTKISNIGTVAINGEEPSESNPAEIVVIEQPKDLVKKVKNGSNSYVDSITIKKGIETTLDYQISFTMPDTFEGYENFILVDEAPTGTTFEGTPTFKVGGTSIGTVSKNSSGKLIKVELSKAQLAGLEGKSAILSVQVKVPANYSGNAADGIVNTASYWINPTVPGESGTNASKPSGDPDDETENTVDILEMPKDLVKKVKDPVSGTYKDTISITHGKETTLDYQIAFTLPSSLAGYEQLIVVDEAPEGTTFEGTPSFTIDGSNKGTVSTNSNKKLVKVELTDTQLAGLGGKVATLNVKIKVPADYSGDLSDGIVNTASFWVNPKTPGGTGTDAGKPTDDPDDETDNTVGLIEQPKDLVKKVKNESGTYVDSITIKKGTETTLNYQITFTMPSSFDGYEKFILVDEAPAGTTFEGTSTFTVDGVSKGTLSTNSNKKLIKVELTKAQLAGLEGKVATLSVAVKVPADYSGNAADGIVNTASYWINPAVPGDSGTGATKPGGDPDDETENTVDLLEMPKDLVKKVKNPVSGSYVDTISIIQGEETTLDYQITFTMPSTLAGYEQLIVVDEAPEGTTFEGTPSFTIDGSNKGTVSTNSNKKLVKVELTDTQLAGLGGKVATLNVKIKVPADYAGDLSDGIVNTASLWVNPKTPGGTGTDAGKPTDDPDDETDNTVGIIEKPKDLVKKVKDENGTYVNTILINKGTETTLDYQITFTMPDSFDGYEKLIIVDEAPEGTTFEGVAAFTVGGVVKGTISTNTLTKKLVRVELTKTDLTGLEGKQAVLNVQVKVPSTYAGNPADGIVNTASYWINPSAPGSNGTNATKPGGDPDEETTNTVTMNGAFGVTYDPNGAKSGTVPTDSTQYPINSEVTVKDNTGNLAIPDYKFVGWNTEADGTGTSYDPEGTNNKFNMPSSNVTLYAEWEVSKDIGILKRDGSNGNAVMEGVTFELKKDATTLTDVSDGNGELDFTELGTGTYTLHETETLEGYQLPYGHWEVTITENTADMTVSVDFQAIKAQNGGTPPAVEYDSTAKRYVIYNYQNYDLPKTGTTVTALLIMLFGLMLLGFTGMIYFKKGKKRGV